jgi:8-oxo-dGTP diphosphatase
MSPIQTKTQVSAGGVAFHLRDDETYVALISVGKGPRWQLPKGLVDKDESIEAAAMREVREEAGIETDLIQPIDRIEYWFNAANLNGRFRCHKFVHFYLLRYRSGDVSDHDHEVNEARWVEINRAVLMLSFPSERKVLKQAKKIIEDLSLLDENQHSTERTYTEH